MKGKNFVYLLLGMLILSVSCKNNFLQENEPYILVPSNAELSKTKTSTLNDGDRVLLSQVVANMMLNRDFRVLIKSEAEKQFDGDFDVLYRNIKKTQLSKGTTVDDLCFENYVSKKGTKANKKDFEYLVNSIPDFQISVPINCDKWDVNNQIPLVTYIPENFDEKTTEYLNAYDYKGNVYKLSVKDVPDVPVVVLGSCERLDYNVKYVEIGGGSGYGNGNGNGNGSGGLYLVKLKFNDLSEYETWVQGKPEICIDIHEQGNEYALGQLSSKPKRKEVSNKWKTYDHRFCSWPTGVNRVYAKCYEKDKNNTTTVGGSIKFAFKIKVFGVTVSVTPKINIQTKFKNGDDDMGTYMIQKTDASYGEYGNSNLMMYFRH